MGTPGISKYPRQEIEDEIVARISNGETLRAICRDDHTPHFTQVYDWLAANPEFQERFEKARLVGFDAIAQECLAIIDETPEYCETEGGRRVDSGYVQWKKYRVWCRLQLLARWDPKRYGERISTELTGPGGGALKIDEVRRVIIDAVGDARNKDA